MERWITVLVVAVVAGCVVGQSRDEAEALKPPKKPTTCGEARLCCQGRNNTCRAWGARVVPKLDENGLESPYCFCDSACVELGDCCTDFKDHCKAVDCELSQDYGPWKGCSSRCGWGIKERSKHVVVAPKNGGAKCPPHHQKLSCYGINCKVPRTPNGFLEMRETGKIIPAMYGSWRRNKLYDPYTDIRKNLFNHYSANAVNERPPYCAKYEIRESRRSCQLNSSRNPWAAELKAGATVCVECQGLAMKKKLGVRCKGHGVYNKETSWNAITVPGCHGEWVMKTRHEECTCDPNSGLSFIFI